MNWREIANKAAYWLLPPGFKELIRFHLLHRHEKKLTPEESAELHRNVELRNRHQGERCFILATGPSIKQQNLKVLSGETSIAVSSFFVHPDYSIVNPSYHCVAPYHLPLAEGAYQAWLAEMASRSGEATMIFPLADKARIETNGRFVSRDKYFLQFGASAQDMEKYGVDLTRPLLAPQSVVIMALQAANYMGFREIYLLGCDHDSLWRWDGSPQYHIEHFFENAPTIGYEPFNADIALKAHLQLREQYRMMNRFVLDRGAKIINANPKSYIDIFPKVSLETLFNK